jgi:hypothetical protein
LEEPFISSKEELNSDETVLKITVWSLFNWGEFLIAYEGVLKSKVDKSSNSLMFLKSVEFFLI